MLKTFLLKTFCTPIQEFHPGTEIFSNTITILYGLRRKIDTSLSYKIRSASKVSTFKRLIYLQFTTSTPSTLLFLLKIFCCFLLYVYYIHIYIYTYIHYIHIYIYIYVYIYIYIYIYSIQHSSLLSS